MLSIFREAIAAGICIGLGGCIFLSVENKTLGAFLFAFGLLTIVLYRLKLYTGAIGYWRRGFDLRQLLVILFGNFIGTALAGNLPKLTEIPITANATALILKKGTLIANVYSDPIPPIVLGIFCGFLMFLGVDAYKTEKLPAPARVIMIFLAVGLFIICKFEHCIADMFYLNAANYHAILAQFGAGRILCFILLVILGNSIGSLFLSRLFFPKNPQ